jgi:hypothetical protein
MTNPHFRQIASKHGVHSQALKQAQAGVSEMLKGDLDLERTKYDSVYLQSVYQFLLPTPRFGMNMTVRNPDIFRIFKNYSQNLTNNSRKL